MELELDGLPLESLQQPFSAPNRPGVMMTRFVTASPKGVAMVVDAHEDGLTNIYTTQPDGTFRHTQTWNGVMVPALA